MSGIFCFICLHGCCVYSKYERNMMIFDWLHTLDPAGPHSLDKDRREGKGRPFRCLLDIIA